MKICIYLLSFFANNKNMQSGKQLLSCEYFDCEFYKMDSLYSPYAYSLNQESHQGTRVKLLTIEDNSQAKNEVSYDNKSLSIMMNPQSLKSFAIMVSSIPQNIISLSIVNSYLGHKIVRNLAPCLRHLPSLEYLDLSGNYIEDRGMNLLRESGDCLEKLDTFIICLNHISYKGALLVADFYIFRNPMHAIVGNFNLHDWEKYQEAVKTIDLTCKFA
ncbi:unnamed protein product [Blepharisma stoltei]|uniref:Uncharacterized protein n=1 Tax=Blepharisma stoltei TaxID=1481888 RepID=A0AAU9JG56_9CILI|nr:unnamed protein product [Blepharisma stoltei]